MYFSVNGRWHTRLLTLVGPFCLTWGAAAVYGDRDYWLLFGLMAMVGLTLDVGVYGWLIGYQPRWLTIGLGGAEFLLLKWIVEWPYPFEIRLHTRQALVFYGVAWLMTWATTQLILPWLRPRWTEEGGEMRGLLPRFHLGRSTDTWHLAYWHRLYLTALGMTFMTRLPWLAALTLAPTGRHFTGLLVAERWHLTSLAAATASAGGAAWSGLEGLVGVAARLGRWPVLDVYLLSCLAATFTWFLCIQVVWPSQTGNRIGLGAAALAALLAPPVTLFLSALIVWAVARLPVSIPSNVILWRRLVQPVVILAVVVWGLAWARVPVGASPAYVSEAEWQTLTWLRQSAPSEAVVAAPFPLSGLISALSGHRSTTMSGPANLYVTAGNACQQGHLLFAHGGMCIVDAPGQ